MTLRQALVLRACKAIEEAESAGATWQDLANARGIIRGLDGRGVSVRDSDLCKAIEIALLAKNRAIKHIGE